MSSNRKRGTTFVKRQVLLPIYQTRLVGIANFYLYCLYLSYLTSLKEYPGYQAIPCFLRPHLVEDEIPQAVEDIAIFVFLQRLNNMRMVTQYQRGPVVNCQMSKSSLTFSW